LTSESRIKSINHYELIAITKQLDNQLEDGVSLVIVDYIQLMDNAKKGATREQEIGEISRALKGLAKDLSIPVIALSQLNRNLENRTDKVPRLSDLRESGSIEQDADIILFIYRDEVYNDDSEKKGIAEIIIAKHRNGPTGSVKLAFVGKYTRFANLSTQYQQQF
ncbi:MAG: DnaB-like helicase C-terminal domain-containing protein, partial [Candidatus Zixiibacteriota bacterium]